jgi:hypothetical protein
VARPYDRPATIVALVNAGVVYALPLAAIALVALFVPDYSTSGTTVRARGPDFLENQVRLVVSYAVAVAPFAMAAAARTFVHAKRWLEVGDRAWWGVIEGGACGLLAAVLILLPGILMRPTEAPPYVLVYGGGAMLVGLGVGAILSLTAMITLHLLSRRRTASMP